MSVLQSVTQDNSLGMVLQIQRGCQRRDRTRGAVETEVTCGAKNYTVMPSNAFSGSYNRKIGELQIGTLKTQSEWTKFFGKASRAVLWKAR